MQKISLSLALSLSLVTAVLGIGFGYYLTPYYQSTMYDQTMGLGAADRWVDKRYLDSMTSHHLVALNLAAQAEKYTSRPEIKALAKDIQANEPKLIAELYGWKKDWYQDTTQVKNPNPINLGTADDKFDLRFLNALIAHHNDGIAMTKEIRGKSTRLAVLNNADAVENFLITTKQQLNSWRQDWYQVESEE